MRIISIKALRDHWEKPGREDSKSPLEAWHAEAKAAVWKSFADIKRSSASASSVANQRVVFNIGGNKYRLIVKINYAAGVIFIRFIGTHQEYDQIDASNV